jgi:hypothetical protein
VLCSPGVASGRLNRAPGRTCEGGKAAIQDLQEGSSTLAGKAVGGSGGAREVMRPHWEGSGLVGCLVTINAVNTLRDVQNQVEG